MSCEYVDHLDTGITPSGDGCVECLDMGGQWVHLRRGLACGHVGCCDSSPGRHATDHFHAFAHPLIQSFEPGEEWIWCYLDELGVEVPGAAPSPATSPSVPDAIVTPARVASEAGLDPDWVDRRRGGVP